MQMVKIDATVDRTQYPKNLEPNTGQDPNAGYKNLHNGTYESPLIILSLFDKCLDIFHDQQKNLDYINRRHLLRHNNTPNIILLIEVFIHHNLLFLKQENNSTFQVR